MSTKSAVIRMVTLASALGIWLGGKSCGQAEPSSIDYVDEDLGIRLALPDNSWQKTDHSQGNAKVFVFSPDKQLITRCSVLHMPQALLPEGILTREKQLQAMLKDTYERVSLDNVTFCDREARRLEYRLRKSRTVEWELEDGDSYLIFQLAALETSWKDPETKRSLESIRDSLQFSGAKTRKTPESSGASPKQIRSARQAMVETAAPSFELRHHELHVDIEPDSHSLHVRDRLTLRALVDDLKQITLYVSEVTVQRVEGPTGLTWEVQKRKGGQFEDANVEELKLTFSQALPEGQDVTVNVVAHSDDFLHAIDQQLVAEVAVLGQVRERSSYSSHVIYYPVDERKDGSMDMTLTVPEGMTAVTGGQLVSSVSEDGRSVFRYKTDDRRPRLLPFGFAAGNYIQRSGRSAAGLRLTFYGYADEEKLLDQRVKVGVEAANVFERLMGPLPWQDVRFAHVTPQRKETGVSLPGLILISDAFFTDFANVDVSDGNLQNLETLSLLVVADELSHQWNAYAVPLPNQLAEGISTFTNVLFMEHRAGRATFDNAIKFCRNAYFMSSALGKDVAIADPAIYQTAAYRGIAFTKTAVALAMLRDLVGDDLFFAAWREAFQEFGDDQDGFEVVESAFSKTIGEDLRWFFDQWFYRPGWAKLKITHTQNGKNVRVVCAQTQVGDPFTMPVKLLAQSADGKSQAFVAPLDSTETIVELECDFLVNSVVIDPTEIGLVQLIEEG